MKTNKELSAAYYAAHKAAIDAICRKEDAKEDALKTWQAAWDAYNAWMESRSPETTEEGTP